MISRLRLRILLLLATLSVAGAPGLLAGQAPTFDLGVRSPAEGSGAMLTTGGLLQDRALQRAVESGLPLRFHLRVELWRKGFFDRLRDGEDRQLVLVQDPIDREFRLDNGVQVRRFADLQSVQRAIERELRPALRATGRGSYYYLASLEIETLSLSDLEELGRWLRGEVRPAVEGRAPAGRAVERGLRRVFVRVIGLPTRRYEARSTTFTIP